MKKKIYFFDIFVFIKNTVMLKIFYCSILDRRPKRMFNVREVLDLLDNSDIEDFIISDEERQADSEDDYNPVQKQNNQRTKTLTDESSDESTDHGTPEPSTFESKKTHNRSEYRWKKIMFEPADSTFCGRKIKASEIKSPLSYFMEYFIDEQMIPFTGRAPAKQFVKGKPSPEGLKNFVSCGKSGIAYDFIIYQGKGTGIDKKYKALGLGGSVVKTLLESVDENVNHKVGFDNYFTSVDLVSTLVGIEPMGTVKRWSDRIQQHIEITRLCLIENL